MRIFDTHAHLLDGHFDEDREAVLSSLGASGVQLVMEACCTKEDIDRVRRFAEENPCVYGSAGVHPQELEGCDESVLEKIAGALLSPKVKAIGEIGLDYHYDCSPREVQKRWLDDQLSLAGEKGVPVIVHDREAHGDCLALLKSHRNGLQGVMHCFSGSYETAKECLDMGLYIAFGGALTFKNATRLREVAAKLPLERLVVETDCPYMTPEPFRGKRNDPGKIPWTLEILAQTKGVDKDALAETLFQNSLRLFHIGE